MRPDMDSVEAAKEKIAEVMGPERETQRKPKRRDERGEHEENLRRPFYAWIYPASGFGTYAP